MEDEKEQPYPQPMLPDVNYQQFGEDCFESLSELEYGALENLRDFLEGLEKGLFKKKMIQVPELILAHLCCYLGVITVILKDEQAKNLEPSILSLLKQHAHLAYEKFNQYPVNSSVKTHQEKKVNLEKLREESPGSIVVQTVRLGRTIMDTVERLYDNRHITLRARQKQEELFWSPDEFFEFLLPLAYEQRKQWEEMLWEKSINNAVNQLTVQIGWLMGYFSHLDRKAPTEGLYLEYGVSCLPLYIDYTHKIIQAAQKNNQKNRKTEEEKEEWYPTDSTLGLLMNEIRNLSQKTHAAEPPAISRFQKETTIVHAGLEKLLIEMIMEKMEIKIILMSLFYFWFTLDAPLRGVKPEWLEGYSPFDEMINIIALVKKIVQSLPEPEWSPDIKELNAKMELLKTHLPHPASFDEVPQNKVEEQSVKVNTAIHTLTSDYLKQGHHPEVIANILFSQWLRLSAFYGVSENAWQKMDHYFVEILTAVRNYLPTIFK